MRARLVDSPNSTIPVMAAPTAPIPVQTAYAVPVGSVFIAHDNSTMLTIIAVMVIMLGVNRLNPWVYFRPTAQTTSNKPAIKRIIQDITYSINEWGRPRMKKC